MSLFQRKAPDYITEVEPVTLPESGDIKKTYGNYVDYYEKKYCKGKFLEKVFKRAKQEVEKTPEADLGNFLRFGGTYDMQTVYLLKQMLVELLPQAKSKDAKKSAYDFNKLLMSQAVNLKISTKQEAKTEDREMRERLQIDA